MKLFQWKKLHSYLALFIGLQLLLWILSGLALNLIDSDYFDANIMREKSTLVRDNTIAIASLERIEQLGLGQISQLSLSHILTRPSYQLTTPTQTITLWADTLTPVTLSSQQLYAIANNSYSGAPITSGLSQANHLANKYSTSAPVYQVQTADAHDTRIIIDGHNGQVLAHVNRRATIKQWLLMVHFMDYLPDNGLSFNHIVIKVFALAACLLGISGSFTLISQLRQRHQPKPGASHFRLLDLQDKPLDNIHLGKGSILDNLNTPKPRLITQCGGGGSCGMCRVKIHHNPPAATEFDLNKLSAEQIAAGIRLACQHASISGDISLTTKSQLRAYVKSA
ncbi:2Fe-2S iron-sulfur cluster-binding protein [Shewanella waksmanii]|uniref:2Fe-2S iron-sulfur cluster-binding protein n=1 Tax=Shewanella waksmanii TaxID=213783 RepID=UPI0037362842